MYQRELPEVWCLEAPWEVAVLVCRYDAQDAIESFLNGCDRDARPGERARNAKVAEKQETDWGTNWRGVRTRDS